MKLPAHPHGIIRRFQNNRTHVFIYLCQTGGRVRTACLNVSEYHRTHQFTNRTSIVPVIVSSASMIMTATEHGNTRCTPSKEFQKCS